MKSTIIITCFITVLLLVFINVEVAESIKIISYDATGGDCTTMGSWNLSSMTCILNTDINDSIQIVNDNMTLDGDGHTITGNYVGEGVYLEGRYGTTIRNLNITNFMYGIYLLRSNNSSLSNITTSGNFNSGIELFEAHDNVIDHNTASFNGFGILLNKSISNIVSNNSTNSNTWSGIQLDTDCDNNTVIGNTVQSGWGITLSGNSNNNNITQNTVTGNTVSAISIYFSSNNNLITDNVSENNDIGILLYDSGGNKIYNNSISNNTTGIRVFYPQSNNPYFYSGGNQIYNNNIIGNVTQAYVERNGDDSDVFNLDKPTGGNFWSNWTVPDTNLDGFVDSPFIFIGGRDNLPWTEQDGWVVPPDTTPPVITILSPQLQDYLHNSTPLVMLFEAWDPSGMATGSPSATLDGIEVNNEQIVNLLTLSIGGHTLVVTATDTLGNTANQVVNFNIIATIDSLISAVNYFAQTGGIDDDRVVKGLLAKLNEALQGLERGNTKVASNKLYDFINHVTSQTNKHIIPYVSNLLIQDANFVLSTL